MLSPLILSRVFYFFYFAAAAALSPFLVLYYERLGFSGTQIGILRGIYPLIMLFSAPLWGAASDATQQHKRLMLLSIGGTLVAVIGLSLTTHYVWLFVIVILFAFFGAPIISLMDNTVLQILHGQKNKYGQQRLWGAVGWGMAGPLVGFLSESVGQQWIFYSYLVLMACAWMVATRMPISQTSIRPQFWRDIRRLMANRQWTIFLVSILIGSMHLSIVNTYLFLHLNALGASETLMGFSLTIATLSEIPVWFFSDKMLRRWQPKGMLIFSLLACAVQAFGYAYMPTPWLILLLQLLHGPSFSAMWAAGVAYAADSAPEGTQATAQGIFGGVAMGMKSVLGTIIGGILYDNTGANSTFRFGGVLAVIGLIIFITNTRNQNHSIRS